MILVAQGRRKQRAAFIYYSCARLFRKFLQHAAAKCAQPSRHPLLLERSWSGTERDAFHGEPMLFEPPRISLRCRIVSHALVGIPETMPREHRHHTDANRS